MIRVSANAKLDSVIFELGRRGCEDLQPMLVLIGEFAVRDDDKLGLTFRFRFARFGGVRFELLRFA